MAKKLCRDQYMIRTLSYYQAQGGIFNDLMNFCFSQDTNIRIDTHKDNQIMQHNIKKHGFVYCGIIYLANGDERLAYQRLSSSTAFPCTE